MTNRNYITLNDRQYQCDNWVYEIITLLLKRLIGLEKVAAASRALILDPDGAPEDGFFTLEVIEDLREALEQLEE